MPFRTDDPSVTIDKPATKESSTMKTRTDEQERAQARIDHDRIKDAQRPKTSRDARQDTIARAKRGDEVGKGADEARANMINRMKEQAQ